MLEIGITIIVWSLIGFFFYCRDNKRTIVVNKEQENYEKELKEKISSLKEERQKILRKNLSEKEQIEKKLLEWKNNRIKEIELQIESEKEKTEIKIQNIIDEYNIKLQEVEENFDFIKKQTEEKKVALEKDLEELKSSLNAGIQARLREQEKKEKIDFYKLAITDTDLSDVEKLESLKSSFHKPIVLSKLIWTQYFQKQMTELCNRVLGKNNICGIYKITNLVTGQCYIGQSLHVSDRWKQHCKCGLGIDAPASNSLYNAMQKDKVWNFTFELLEECSKDELNEKERFWIDMYQSNQFGYNGNTGIGKK